MPFKNPHPLYQVWQSMRGRCRNPNYRQWADYGGRGITICERWDSFAAFVDDMGPRPKGYSLDRIDNDGHYTPDNCRWASRKEQQRNQRRAVYVEIDGVSYRAIELAEKAGVKTDTIVERAAAGLSIDQVSSSDKFFWGGRRLQSHCIRGHEFTPENTYISKEGWRHCRACHNAKMRRRNAASRDRK